MHGAVILCDGMEYKLILMLLLVVFHVAPFGTLSDAVGMYACAPSRRQATTSGTINYAKFAHSRKSRVELEWNVPF